MERRVLVTGGNGFIGSWVVRALLARGYAVTATYQPGTHADHLLALVDDSSTGRPLLLPADLLDADSISAAAAAGGGCRAGVLHVASPCTLADPQDPQAELVEPAVRGTLHVLEAARAVGARRVVVTSSISAMVPNPGWPSAHPGEPVDERSWTDITFCEARKKWYPVSKTLAEEAAWGFAEKHGMEVVTVHPSTCLGPLLQPALNASSAVLQRLLQGSKDDQGDYWLGAVHVRDVAAAHVLVLEAPAASGRYLCTNGIYQFKDFAQLVAKLCPAYNSRIHRFADEDDTQPWLVPCEGSHAAKRLLDLGLVLTPLEEAINDAEKSLRDKGFLP